MKEGKAFLNVHRLEELVCDDLPKLTRRPFLGRQFVGLADRYRSTNDDDTGHDSSSTGFMNSELEQVAQFLLAVVSQQRLTKYMPLQIVSEIHTFRGIIHDMHHDYTLAEQSHLRALWVARNESDCNTDQIAASVQQLEELSSRPRRQGNSEKL